ncbi:anoctamin-like protein, putative [Bodo saltans]|uniref:Anoctamin-like protein, putative n=1 Tax=Bodo saltans TaxID=75058 RepID=A0A0S4IR83_BODSA|nr:anoctamin-like protein, putative [Bodo saltans]|eukprot:CUF37894.1 anoctamin-like protein, putative [Bodo saltans]
MRSAPLLFVRVERLHDAILKLDSCHWFFSMFVSGGLWFFFVEGISFAREKLSHTMEGTSVFNEQEQPSSKPLNGDEESESDVELRSPPAYIRQDTDAPPSSQKNQTVNDATNVVSTASVTLEPEDDDPLKDTNFPFDLVLVFDDSAKGAKEYADNLYSDLVHDGLLACKHVKAYRSGIHRIFIGIGASDRFLHGVVQHYHFTEERTEAREHGGICRIYAQNTRQRILLRFLKLRRYGGPHASFQWLLESKIMLDYYLLHDPLEVRDIRRGFSKYIFLPRPTFIADVEEYFGEELAMYMAWLRTVIVFFGPLCVVYAMFFAFEIAGDYRSWSMAAAGYFAPIYIQCFHEYWKRQEKRLAFEFGTLDMEQNAEVREGYRGTHRLVQWTRDKHIRHEGEEEDTIIIKPGRFELPIQHTIPSHLNHHVTPRHGAHGSGRRSNKGGVNSNGQSPTTAVPPSHGAVAPATGSAAQSPIVATESRSFNPNDDKSQEQEEEDPFTVKVVQQLEFDQLPEFVMERHYPNSKRWIAYGVSIPTSLVFCVAVMVAIYAIDFIREVLSDSNGNLPTNYSIAVSVINGVVIVVFNTLYPIITFKLCEWENHRTRDSFENAYILKLFIFVFVNSYFPIFLQVFKLYIFSSDKLDAGTKEERIEAVVIQIFTACISTVFVSNIQDLVVPFFLGPAMDKLRVWWAGKQHKKKVARSSSVGSPSLSTEPTTGVGANEPSDMGQSIMSPTTAAAIEAEEVAGSSSSSGNFITRKFTRMESALHVFEHQMQLSEPQPVTARFMGRIILLGFALIFASLFPLGMAFVFIDAVITTRVEVVRYLYLMRRMAARQVESIGGWSTCIQALIVCASISNCLILSLRSDSLVEWYGLSGTWESRLTVFIATEHIVMFIVFAVEYIIPDTSYDIEQIKALQRYLMLKDQNRLNYDPIDLQMPSHVLIAENILPNDNSNTIATDLCVQCHVTLHPGEDVVRKFPCHHHIHEKCLEHFRRHNGDPGAAGGAGGGSGETPVSNGDGQEVIVAACPSCEFEIDCRYFDTLASYQKYAPVRYRIVDEFAEDPDVQNTAAMVEVLKKENELLVRMSSVYGLSTASFPTPGPAPTGRPPRSRKRNAIEADESDFFEY